MGKHQFGDIIPTVPKTRKCERCGGYVIAEKIGEWHNGTPPMNDPGLLPFDMELVKSRKCQDPKYTEYELQESLREASEYGRHEAIRLRPEFEKEMLKKFRFNVQTQRYEMPKEQYYILRDKFANNPSNKKATQ